MEFVLQSFKSSQNFISLTISVKETVLSSFNFKYLLHNQTFLLNSLNCHRGPTIYTDECRLRSCKCIVLASVSFIMKSGVDQVSNLVEHCMKFNGPIETPLDF